MSAPIRPFPSGRLEGTYIQARPDAANLAVSSTAPLLDVPPDGVRSRERLRYDHLSTLAQLSRLAATSTEMTEVLPAVAGALRRAGGFDLVAVFELDAAGLQERVVERSACRQDTEVRLDERLFQISLREGRAISEPSAGAIQVYAPIRSAERVWGALIVETPGDHPLDREDLDLLHAVSDQLALAMGAGRLRERLAEQGSRAQVLASVTSDLSSRLELPVIMTTVVDHAMRLFRADRAAVYQRLPSGLLEARYARNLSRAFTDAMTSLPRPSVGAEVMESGRATSATGYADDPRGAGVRDLVLREGFDSVAIAALVADGEILGMLALYHDRRHEWAADDLQILETLGAQAGIAVRNARNYAQMASWAAQLQSIQQVGARLTRLTTVTEIGRAIVTELRQVIDYHNVRVYRIRDQELVPVAWRGEIVDSIDEDDERLRVRIGQGITGWVAQHGVAQYLPDAAADPRTETIPGTEDDDAESMLVAAMLYDDRVIGVIVLVKPGIDQFSAGDELRLLEIYASLAAQAMANADATERLRAQSERLTRQVTSQRELMRVTESILSTLDQRVVMEGIADRLGNLVNVDNLGIDAYDAEAGMLRPIFARGVHADRFMATTMPDTAGVGGWVARHGRAQLVPDELADSRVVHFEVEPGAGALIVTPLRGADRVIGVLTLERLGAAASFDEDEFELIQLFSGHVSIALQNAMAHRAMELRAQTDALTGLKNHGTFVERLSRWIARGAPFSLLLVDLDDFKSFNDRLGHEAGSQLLARIAGALRASCREGDEIFRYGGDEFALILPGTHASGAVAVAEKVSRAVRGVRVPGSRRGPEVTSSVGVAAFPEDATDRVSLLLGADRACYLAKRQGRARVVTASMVADLAHEEQPMGPMMVGHAAGGTGPPGA